MSKKRTLFKVLSIALMCAMLFPLTAGAVSYPIETDDRNLSYWLPMQPIASKYLASYNEHMIFKIIGENTGMNVNFLNASTADAATQLGLLVAGGELPDILQIRTLYPGGAAAGVSEGIFADLTPYIKEFAPDYYAAITTSDLAYRLATDSQGRILAFHIIKATAPAFNRMNYLQEVMDDLQLDIPATIADCEEDFEAMKQKGMSGVLINANGQQDIFMWPFGITPGWCLDENGKVQYGQYTQNYKDYLTLMNKWYSAGYIYKDFMSSMTDAERRALFTNKVVGMFPDAVDLANSAAAASGLNSQPLPYVRLTDGQGLHFEVTNAQALPEPSMATVVSAASKNIEAAVQYLNYYYTKAGADLCNWGVKDVYYTEDANGVKTFTDMMLNNPNMPLGDVQMNFKLHLQAKLAEPDVVCNPNVVANEVALEKRMRYSDDAAIDGKQVLPAMEMNPEASEARSDIMTDINTYVDEMTLQFIIGLKSLDEFDNYLAQLKSMGIEDAIAITQEQYDAFMNKPGIPN